METSKKIYTTPTLIVHGDVSTITQATSSGGEWDRTWAQVQQLIRGGQNANDVLMNSQMS